MKKLLVVCILVGLVAGATAYYRMSYPRAPHYPTNWIDYGPIAEVIRGTGLVEVRNPVVVMSQGSGEVIEVSPDADFGRTVIKDQKLAQIDDRVASLELERARALLDAAINEQKTAEAAAAGFTLVVERMNQKPDSYGIELLRAQAELGAAKARIKSAEAKVKEAEKGVEGAELRKSLTTIKSPADGVIIDRKVARGQLVGPSLTTPLFIIAPNMAEMRVLALISQADIGKVLPNQKAIIALFTSAEKPAERAAIVRETRPAPTQLPGAANTPGSVFYSAVIDVPNTKRAEQNGVVEWELRHGMTADVTIYLRPEEIAWKAPKDGIDLDLEDKYLSTRAKARLTEWNALKRSPDEWKRIWVLENNEPWPVFIRVMANNGEKGLQNDQHQQFFDWDWGEPTKRVLNASAVESIPPVIVNKPESTPGAIDRLLKSFKPT